MTSNKDLTSVYKIEKWQFVLTGLYPKPKHANALFYYPRTVLVFLVSSIIAVSMIVSLIIGVDEIKELTDILYFLITEAAYLWKLSNFVIGSQKIKKIEEHLAKPISYKFLDKYGMHYLTEIMGTLNFAAKIFRVCLFLAVIFYTAFPLFDGETQLPFAGWFPVDKVTFRIPIYILQILCLATSAFTNGNLDLFTAYTICIGITLLKTLKECLRNVDYAEGSRNDLTEKDLESLVYLHEHILEYIALVEDMFSNGIFIQFLASIGVICMTGFQLLIVPVKSAQFLMLLSYTACVMCQVALYCWYGNEVLFESDGITDACYMSNWYEGTPESKKIVFLIMERSKRKIKLTAGKFFILSLTTLLLILKSSYSYFAVLRRMYAEE